MNSHHNSHFHSSLWVSYLIFYLILQFLLFLIILMMCHLSQYYSMIAMNALYILNFYYRLLNFQVRNLLDELEMCSYLLIYFLCAYVVVVMIIWNNRYPWRDPSHEILQYDYSLSCDYSHRNSYIHHFHYYLKYFYSFDIYNSFHVYFINLNLLGVFLKEST